MEELFLDILQHIAENMPELSLVDENYGQLETQEDTYPVTFPCVLIDAPQVSWETLMPASQQGRCSLTVRLAVDCYEDTHYGSGTQQGIVTRARMAAKLNGLLNFARPRGAQGPMTRTASRTYTLQGGIKVYETEYQTTLIDEG